MGESFSKQICKFVFIFYPKEWTMPNMAIRHVHDEKYPRRSYHLNADRKCACCDAVCPDELIGQAVASQLNSSQWFTPEVVFKSIKLQQLSSEWYVRSYANVHTKMVRRYIFYHDCYKKAHLNTFPLGLYDHLLPYLEHPFACQVCKTPIPKSVLMAIRLQKAKVSL